MLLHHHNKILRREAAEGRATKIRIFRQEPFRCGSGVGEIAASTTRDQDFGAYLGGMIEQQYAPPSTPGGNRAHQARGASTNYDHIVFGYGRR